MVSRGLPEEGSCSSRARSLATRRIPKSVGKALADCRASRQVFTLGIVCASTDSHFLHCTRHEGSVVTAQCTPTKSLLCSCRLGLNRHTCWVRNRGELLSRGGLLGSSRFGKQSLGEVHSNLSKYVDDTTQYYVCSCGMRTGDHTKEAARISDETQSIQNQLLGYRSDHLPELSKLELSARGLSSDFNAIASALGECVVGALDLHDYSVSLLRPYSEQQIAEPLGNLGTMAICAAVVPCH
jgi:hypothetical protein